MMHSIVFWLFIGFITGQVICRFDNPDFESEVKRDESDTSFPRAYSRQRRYLIFGGKFAWTPITYKIKTYTKHMSNEMADLMIDKAFDQWAAVTDLTFMRVESGPANIEIGFPTSKTDSGFDGPGNIAGRVRNNNKRGFYNDLLLDIDDDEPWRFGAYKLLGMPGLFLYDVALHEIGHALGLDHSQVAEAVMYRTTPKRISYGMGWEGSQTIIAIHVDDIDGMSKIYPVDWTSADIRTAWQCEHTTFHLQCTDVNQKIHIVSAEFGSRRPWQYENPLNCPSQHPDANCIYPTTSVIGDRCNMKNSCDVYIVVDDMVDKGAPDPCPGITKTLQVRYVCLNSP